MAPEEEASNPETPQTDTSVSRSPHRRGRRSGRGRRGRGHRGRSKAQTETTAIPPEERSREEQPEPIFELAAEQRADAEPEAAGTEPVEPLEEPAVAEPAPVAPTETAPTQTASRPSVEKAIEEVNGIVDALRGALDDMEEVLEMLEAFERQNNADEREIESLRRALRQMHRPRDGGHPHR